jgi:hypothetical protein
MPGPRRRRAGGSQSHRRRVPHCMQQTLQVPTRRSSTVTGLCFFMPPFPGVWAPGPPRISISSSLRFTYLLEALKTLDLWILQVAKHAGPALRVHPPPPSPPGPPNFSKFFMPRAARARRPPGAGAFSSHRFRTRGSAFLISRYSYLLIEASEFFLKVTNLHEIILIFIKL